MTADDIVWLKDTLVADATAVGKKEARTHTTGLTRKAYRDGAAQLRPGVSRADVRDAQVISPLPRSLARDPLHTPSHPFRPPSLPRTHRTTMTM